MSRTHVHATEGALSDAFNHSYSYDDTVVAQVALAAREPCPSGADTMTQMHNCVYNGRYGDGVHLTEGRDGDAAEEPVDVLRAHLTVASDDDDNESRDRFPWSTIHNERREMERRVKQLQDSVDSLRDTV